ncbi:hypothetical protein Ahy_B10g101267 [Arachis hypogaea]|uniref:Uncharacterized protein n=1 Tax=Arachis hypogaea TaxID=3818 RepID=A0A444WZB7_ARAHY|nr:hypothetical protein Ahy_B10g101267 [Arachis hypogaea]
MSCILSVNPPRRVAAIVHLNIHAIVQQRSSFAKPPPSRNNRSFEQPPPPRSSHRPFEGTPPLLGHLASLSPTLPIACSVEALKAPSSFHSSSSVKCELKSLQCDIMNSETIDESSSNPNYLAFVLWYQQGIRDITAVQLCEIQCLSLHAVLYVRCNYIKERNHPQIEDSRKGFELPKEVINMSTSGKYTNYRVKM